MKYILAPLAGFTDAAFRLLCSAFGADLTYTEMVSAAGLAHGSSPTRHLLELLPGETNVACQLFGSVPDELAFSARFVSSLHRFVSIDLNAGCPVPRITHEGAGSALVKKPDLVHTLLAAMVRESSIPVTLKTRPGPRPDRILMLELLDAAERAGASSITLHARFTSQNHGGEVHLDLLSELVEKSHIPVIGNGGITDLASAQRMAETGVSGLMIGRGAVADPTLFARLKGLSTNCTKSELFDRHLASLMALREQIVSRFPNDHLPSPDAWASVALHTRLFRYFSGLPGAGEIRRRLNSIRTLAEVEAIGSQLRAYSNMNRKTSFIAS